MWGNVITVIFLVALFQMNALPHLPAGLWKQVGHFGRASSVTALLPSLLSSSGEERALS